MAINKEELEEILNERQQEKINKFMKDVYKVFVFVLGIGLLAIAFLIGIAVI